MAWRPNRRPLCSELPLSGPKPASRLNTARRPSPRSSLPRSPKREPLLTPCTAPMRLCDWPLNLTCS
ncbi:Uncharacterised protein [Bordetella pertussis]|nr:Uncharacterised protein [Bordetella pertussis]